MISILEFIAAPIIACVILLVITSYFGIHVLKREIIFIDIALAQIAVLGGIAALFLDLGDGYVSNTIAYLFSLVFSVGAALIFTFLKNPKINIPIEAFIGIAYALATTAAVIILDKGAGGDVHLHDMLTGALLWITWTQVIRLSIVVLVVGSFHFIFRKQFIELSENYNTGSESIRFYKLWDFLFYFSFSIVVIEAVRIAGILTVFAFLILPASISSLFQGTWLNRILIGWSSGILAALIGLYLSMILDLTASPLIILLLAVILLIGVIIKKFLVQQAKC